MTVAKGAPARRGTARPAGRRLLKSKKVVELLGLAIVSGERVPGSLLPTEAMLSTRLKISRASLRQGLHALALKGLVEGRTRRGTIGTTSRSPARSIRSAAARTRRRCRR